MSDEDPEQSEKMPFWTTLPWEEASEWLLAIAVIVWVLQILSIH